MNIYNKIKNELITHLEETGITIELINKSAIESPRDSSHGDIALNIAMIASKVLKKNPRELAEQIKSQLIKIDYIETIDIAGPGFINLTLKNSIWHDSLTSILNNDDDFWIINEGKGYKINVEYVSANPTGPMHIGHARGAVYGDALANILKKCGYNVIKEYYINDAGSQIDTLVKSAYYRYLEVIDNTSIDIPEGCYPGEYLIPIGKKLADKYSDKLKNISEKERYDLIKSNVISAMMSLIKDDLANLGVHHDVFFSEQQLHDSNKIEEVTNILKDKDLVYRGVLPPPKGKIDEDWEEKEQLLFKSSEYGDDQDRAIQKSNGDWSYLAADFAYAKDKIDREFDTLVYILGADHGGYVKRIKAVINALSDGKVESDIRISQLVNFLKNGNPVKMSKRSGDFLTVNDVVSEIGKDIIRFIMLTRRSDMSLDFDFDKVKEQSKDNPVFYVQYAHVRCLSILTNAKNVVPSAYSSFQSKDYNLSRINSSQELEIVKLLSAWPKTLSTAAKHREPHRIAYYLIEISTKFHSLWNLGKENNNYRFTVENDEELTSARLGLAKAVLLVIANGLETLGVKPLEKM